jgi:mercuric ion transport protein
MESTERSLLLGAGTVLSAVAASLCCILPVVVATLGVGSAALGGWFEPARPYFLALTVLFLALGFYQAYRPRECPPGQECAVPARLRRQRILLWILTPVALLLMTFPYYVEWLV